LGKIYKSPNLQITNSPFSLRLPGPFAAVTSIALAPSLRDSLNFRRRLLVRITVFRLILAQLYHAFAKLSNARDLLEIIEPADLIFQFIRRERIEQTQQTSSQNRDAFFGGQNNAPVFFAFSDVLVREAARNAGG
jgi:hypothetical protein